MRPSASASIASRFAHHAARPRSAVVNHDSPATMVTIALPFSRRPANGRVTALRNKFCRVHCPFHIRIDNRDIRARAFCQRAALHSQQPRALSDIISTIRAGPITLRCTSSSARPSAVSSPTTPLAACVSASPSPSGSRPQSLAGAEEPGQPFHPLGVRIVRRMIGRDHIYRAVSDRRTQRLDVARRAQRRRHLRVRTPSQHRAIVEREVMRRDLAGDAARRACGPRG